MSPVSLPQVFAVKKCPNLNKMTLTVLVLETLSAWQFAFHVWRHILRQYNLIHPLSFGLQVNFWLDVYQNLDRHVCMFHVC